MAKRDQTLFGDQTFSRLDHTLSGVVGSCLVAVCFIKFERPQTFAVKDFVRLDGYVKHVFRAHAFWARSFSCIHRYRLFLGFDRCLHWSNMFDTVWPLDSALT